MNVSHYYLTILLILGSQRTAQDRNFLPFQCMPPAAACSFIFANASHGQGLGWRLKPTSTEVVMVNPAPCSPWPPYDNLDKSCCFKEVPPKTKGTTKSQNKLKLSWKNETWRNSMPKFQSQPIYFKPIAVRSLRFQVPRDVAMLLLAPNHVVHGERMSNIPFGTDVLVRGWPHVFFVFEIEAYSQFFPVQFQVPGPVLPIYLRFDWMSTVYWCTLFWMLWC